VSKPCVGHAKGSEESPHYHLGHYYDLQCAGMPAENRWAYNQHTCAQYLAALKCGTKYIYQTMPRMLTLWLDMGESKDLLLEAKAVKKG
jgi:serine/threonine-protein kinase ATR